VARGRRRLLLGAVAVIAGVVVVVLLVVPSSGSSKNDLGGPAPLFVSTDLDGRQVALASYRGQRVLLNFWASWCVPCRAEFPILKKLQATQAGVVVLGIVFEDTASRARAFLRSEGATWPGVMDPDGQVASAYGVHAKPGIPVSILIDPTGHIRGRHLGPLASETAADQFVDLAPAH
jgi:cytochrome c biogenesis protein CcmG, thiol:disulfide interchange protein DsbE